jgi:hypothetical protein
MNSEIILDLQATINNPGFRWPLGFDIKIEGYKYTLEVEIDNPYIADFSFSVRDADEQPYETDYATVMCLRDWIATNVLPHYLVLN